jgi:hypothetical protein
VSGLEHCQVFTESRQKALRQIRKTIAIGKENDKPELLAVAVLQLGADVSNPTLFWLSRSLRNLTFFSLKCPQMLTRNPSWRETLRIAYRLLREQGGPQMVLNRLAAEFDVGQPSLLSHLAASMRCILQALFVLDVYGQYAVGSSLCPSL